MAVRTLDTILAEQSKFSDPSRQAILGQISNLPQEQQAAESGLNAKLQDRLGDITASANRKGNFYSGLPIAEQQRYTATEYAPALAGLKSNYLDKSTTLTNTLAGLNANDYQVANSIYGQEQSLAEQQRQFDLNYQLQQQQARAAAASQNSLASILNGRATNNGAAEQQQQVAPTAQNVDPNLQWAYNQVFSRKGQPIEKVLSDYQATLNSAQRGNTGDRMKIELYHQMFPEIFSASPTSKLTDTLAPGVSKFSNRVPAAVLQNGSKLSF